MKRVFLFLGVGDRCAVNPPSCHHVWYRPSSPWNYLLGQHADRLFYSTCWHEPVHCQFPIREANFAAISCDLPVFRHFASDGSNHHLLASVVFVSRGLIWHPPLGEIRWALLAAL